MTLVLVIALLVLTIAVVLLYAMMGELSARVPESESGPDPASQIHELEQYNLGSRADFWPVGLARFDGARAAVVLVLSPVCKTCTTIASELGALGRGALDDRVGLVVSTGQREVGEEFVRTHRLAGLPHVVDEGGEWVTGQFGVNMSPSALIFDHGTLVAAYTFGSLEAVRIKINEALTEGELHAQVSH